MKITSFPFTVSAALFGVVALTATLVYSLIIGASLIRSDDPYIIGLVLASITALASFMYLLLKEIKFRWLNANYCIAAYYAILTAYCMLIEYIGGEASGYGYFYLSSIALTIPAFLLVVLCRRIKKYIRYGILSGLLYLAGYIHVLSNRM